MPFLPRLALLTRDSLLRLDPYMDHLGSNYPDHRRMFAVYLALGEDWVTSSEVHQYISGREIHTYTAWTPGSIGRRGCMG